MYAQAGDDELLALAGIGEKQALAELYHRYGRMVYALALRITGDAAAAEDAAQETFIKAWKAAARFESDGDRVAAWLFLIARNTALDMIRARSRVQRLYTVPPPPPSSPADPADDATQMVLTAEVRRALVGLSAEQRQALEMAYFQGLTHHQIARQTRLPLGTVKGRLRLGLENLRKRLVGWAQEGGQSHG